MNKRRFSFSILNAWDRGDKKGATDMYYKVFRPTNSAMTQGLEFHKTWETYTNKYKKLHPHLSSKNTPLRDPRSELKLEVDITPTIQFVGVIDCLDEPILYEFKSGGRPSSEHANSKQADCYALILKKLDIKVDKAFYLHYDQIIKETDSAMVWITEDRLNKAQDWIIKNATEFTKYIEDNDLDILFKPEEVKLEVLEEIE